MDRGGGRPGRQAAWPSRRSPGSGAARESLCPAILGMSQRPVRRAIYIRVGRVASALASERRQRALAEATGRRDQGHAHDQDHQPDQSADTAHRSTPAPTQSTARDLASRRVYNPFRRHLVPPGRKPLDVAPGSSQIRAGNKSSSAFASSCRNIGLWPPELRRVRRFETS